jgi:hypothetical protein
MSSIESNQESKTLLTDEEVLNLKKEEQAYDFDNPEFTFIPKGIHNWRAEGIYLVCRSCEIHHAVYIGPNKIFIGIDSDGKPMLVDSEEYFKNGYKYYENKKNK